MFAKYNVVKDASYTENIANGLRFSCHVLYVNDLRSHVAWSTTTYEKIIWIICDRCQTKIYNYWLFAENNVVWLQITMNDIFTSHFGKTSENSLQNEFTLTYCVLGKVVESSTNRVALDIFKSEVDRVIRFVDSFQFHKVRMIEEFCYFDLVDEGLLTVLL